MDKLTAYSNPEIWGGIECTINRVHDTFIDQLRESGHYYRENDIEHIASLGIRKLRYPILWEKHQPSKNKAIDWDHTEKQLLKLRENNIDIIAGLVHHGSGPAFTNLVDPDFAGLLAAYASKVAEKFPAIQYYTPVNEPLTTARFSGLYGIWYPHAHDAKSFVQMLLNQLKGTVLAMNAIRKINPEAKLVQTEDLGKTYSTKTLQYQADFENERRWLTYDILCGKFDKQHTLWNYFHFLGIDEAQLNFFLEHPCPPDIFGCNHYLTSERFLDERLERYPTNTHGGNEKHRYADVEAVRVNVEEDTGIGILLSEVWKRYRRPIAITEVHLHCHREEQLRWFKHILCSAIELRKRGIDIVAITSWALLGSFGWNNLLQQPGGEYEPGAFDIRGGYLRPTALARYIKKLTTGSKYNHQLSNGIGWWQRESRIIYDAKNILIPKKGKQSQPILIIGKNGTLGKALSRICDERNIHYHLLNREECDITDYQQIQHVIDLYKPWAVINAAGYVRVDDAENDCATCMAGNTMGPAQLAIACNQKGIQFISFSSDLVFDGKKIGHYVESDIPHPLNIYGRSKAQAEMLIKKNCPDALVIRTSAFFSSCDEYNFAHFVEKKLLQNESIQIAKDIFISPTYIPHLVHAVLDLLIDGENGIWHLSNKGKISWSEWAMLIAEHLQLNKSLIQPVNFVHLNYKAIRPLNSALESERGNLLPSFETALNEYFYHCKKRSLNVA